MMYFNQLRRLAYQEPRLITLTLSSRKEASMRPQPEGRGELPLLEGEEYEAFKLQCGHSQKAVENNRYETISR